MILATLALALAAQAPVAPVAPDLDPEAVRAALARGVDFLRHAQHEDGSFGGFSNATFTSSFGNPATYQCWQIGASALAVETLMKLGTPEDAAAIEKGLGYLVAHQKQVRPAEWDVDNNWSLIYGLSTIAQALADPRWKDVEKAAPLRQAGQSMVDGLKAYQGARGGWGYYADPDAAWRPDWGTSFTTAAAVLSLLQAKKVGLEVDPHVLSTGIDAVAAARLPNGAYSYDVSAMPRPFARESIDDVKGSLGRIQICNYTLLQAGRPLPEDALATGLEQFFRHHMFLDAARNKPIPHEAYYANAAYFYLFGHYYCALAIESLPEADRPQWNRKLQREIVKCQQDDGSFWDFWIADNARVYGTAFSVMALARTLAAAGTP